MALSPSWASAAPNIPDTTDPTAEHVQSTLCARTWAAVKKVGSFTYRHKGKITVLAILGYALYRHDSGGPLIPKEIRQMIAIHYLMRGEWLAVCFL